MVDDNESVDSPDTSNRRIDELEDLVSRQKNEKRDFAFKLAKAILDNCPIPAGIVGKGKREIGRKNFATLLYVNPAFYDYFRHKPETIIGQPYYKFVVGEENEIIKKLSGVPIDEEIQIRSRNDDVLSCRLIKNDLYVPRFGKQLFVLSWFYLLSIKNGKQKSDT